MFDRIRQGTHLDLAFSVLGGYYQLSFFNSYGPIQSVYFFLCGFQQIVSFKGLVHFIQCFQFVSTGLFIILPFYPFDIRVLCSDVLSFISDVNNVSYDLFSSFVGLIDFTDLGSNIYYFFSPTSFSSVLRQRLRSLILDLSSFSTYAYSAIFPLSIAFSTSHPC